MVEPAGDAADWERMTRAARLTLAATLALAACATPAQRITDRLQAAGVPGGEARCMGNRLAARLSASQMVELNRIVKAADGQHLTINRLVQRLGNADPALVGRLVETGIVCAI